MSRLTRLEIYQFRNLNEVKLDLTPKINIFFGKNGSGKTSLLESIYHFSVGRSFRTHLYKRVIQEGKEKFALFGRINSETPIGIERFKKGDLNIKIARERLNSVSEMVKQLPMQVIDPNSYHLLNAGPKIRRQFIDWGVFHVKHAFLPAWQKLQRILKQRNAALKLNNPQKGAEIWNEELVVTSMLVNEERKAYIKQFKEALKTVLTQVYPFEGLNIRYYAGWDEGETLKEILREGIERDIQAGSTQHGPHRADLKLTINRVPVADVFSRGQQKILVCAMRLAQALLLKEMTGRTSIFLIDDLPSELDNDRRNAVVRYLNLMEGQIFMTCIEKDALKSLFKDKEISMFHVEHGRVKKV